VIRAGRGASIRGRADVAQLVEHFTRNEGVRGSSPRVGSGKPCKWLRDTLEQARRGTLPGLVRTRAAVADAAAEYLRYIEHDRERKPSTVQGYRWIIDAQILPTFGQMQLEHVTSEQVERWLAGMGRRASTRTKALA
jgi:Phage integrase, N-terminal SAM-like domain